MKHIATAFATLAVLATPAIALDCTDGMRAYEHLQGTDCIPINPQRIVTLQDQNALLPVMELGVVPVGSAGLAVAGGSHHFRALEAYDTSTVAYVGPYWPGPDAEAVAALEPDLIIANPWVEGAYETYSAIAPTVIMDPNAKPMNLSLMDFADLVGRMDRAKELEAKYEAAAAALREKLGDKLETTTVSIMEYWDGEMSAPPNAQSLSLAVPGLGLIRTPYQQAKAIDDWSAMSPEILGEDDADVMILIAAADEQIGDMTPAVEEFMSNPLVAATEVGQAGQIYPVNMRAIYGTSWAQAIEAMEAIAEIIDQEGLNRDLVIE